MIKYAALGIGAAIILAIIYLYGEAKYGEGVAEAEKLVATKAAELSQQHAKELARAIEETRKQEVQFYAKLSKLREVKDPSGCLDRPVPADFERGLRDATPANRRR